MQNSEWDAHKAEIERIYIAENKPLNQLREIMARTYGFRKTKYQYETKFKQWGIRKYRMGRAKWKYVKRQMEKRDGNAEVYIDRALCSQETVQTEINRQAFETQIEKYHRSPSPQTPEG